MSDKTIVRGWRIKAKTLLELDKFRKKMYGSTIKLNGYIQMILDEKIEENKQKKVK